MLWGLIYGKILQEYNAPGVAYGVPISMLVVLAAMEFFRWLDQGDVK